MSKLTTKSLENIRSKIEGAEEGSVRQKILKDARQFKTSWIDLGQSLYSAWKDKLYKEWGYMTFEAYTSKEIGIKNNTAMKLLKSYYFLEREEPAYLEHERAESASAVTVPSYESVNVLRLAKDKKNIDGIDYASLKKEVFESGKDVSDVRRSLTGIIKQREDIDPDEARARKRSAALKRFLATLRTLKKELEISKMLPASTIKEISTIITKIESEIF